MNIHLLILVQKTFILFKIPLRSVASFEKEGAPNSNQKNNSQLNWLENGLTEKY